MRGVVDSGPLEILYVTAPAKIGGAESVVLTLTTGLLARGHRVTVAASVDAGAGPHQFLETLKAEGVPVELTPPGYAAERRAVIDLAGRMSRPVVHSHGYRSDVLVRSARRALQAPIVSTVHGFTGGGSRNRLYEWLQVRALRGFDAVLPVSLPLAQLLSRRGVPASHVELTPNALASPGIRPDRTEARARLAPDAQGPLIGWVGRLGHEKGCDIFLEALAGMRDVAWTACIVGTGPELAALQEMAARLRLEGRVVWAGVIPSAGRWFPGFDVLALSSRTEGTPIVLLEAMNAALPIVASAVGGVPELLEQGRAGWLVPPLAPRELARALREVLADPAAAAAKGRAARDRAASVYAVEPWLDRHERVYRNLLNARPGPNRS